MSNETTPFTLDFSTGQVVEDILKKAESLADIKTIGTGLSLDRFGNLSATGDGDDEFAASLLLTLDSSTYVLTATLRNKAGETLGTPQTVDLPLESVVVGGSYDDQTKKIVLTLKSGNTVEFSVADLVSGLQTEITNANPLSADLVSDVNSTHKFVTSAEKESWNSKADADASYTKAEVNALLSGKVDKVAGKQLSTEDFTAADKAKLQSLNNYDDTAVRGLISENSDAIESEISHRTTADAELNSAIGVVANSGAKNIINNTADASRVASGVTWIKNPDSSMTAQSGTSTGASAVRVVGVQGQSSYAAAVPIPKGRYTISASGFEQTRFRFVLGLFDDENAERKITYIYNEEVDFVVTSDTARYDFSCIITVDGVTVSGETWYPMIRRAEIKDNTFVQYAPSNRELYEMILALQQNGA